MHGPCHVSEDVVHGGQGGTLMLEGGLQQAENNILLNLYQYVHDCDGSDFTKVSPLRWSRSSFLF